MTVPGVDGQKMSKSYNNTIDIFQPDKQLRKNIMSIITDSTPLEEPKNPDTDTVFALYSLLATSEQTNELRKKYLAGNYGYGHAKQELYEVICQKYSKEREIFNYYMENTAELNQKLEAGESKARELMHTVLQKVKKQLGY